MVIYSSDAIAAADAGKIDDLRNLGIDTAKVEQAKQQRTAAQQTITGSAQSLNVQVGDVGNLSQAEIANLIRAGVDVNLIVTAGNNPNTVNSAIDSIRAQITEAKATISGYKTIQDGKEVYTLSDLARFQREHPNDTTTLAFLYDSKTLDNIASFNKQVADSVNAVGVMLGGRSYGPEGMALDRALRSAGISVIPTVASSKVIVGADGFGTVMYFDASGRALSDKDILASKWDKLSDEQKQQVAAIYARDLYKGSYLGEIIGSMQDIVAETTAESGPVVGTLISLPFFPVTGLEGFAHQSALRQIQTQLKTDYASEINVLQDYRNKDGTFDVGKINEAFKANPIEAQRILQGLALPDAQSVSDRLKYFNQNWKVSLSEWIIAGATVPADILMVTGGGTLLGMGATARTSAEAAAMATRARIIGAVGTGIGATFLGVGLAEQIPNWKNMTPAERYTALGMDAVMLAGMGLGIKEIAKGNAAAKVDPKSIIDRSIDADAAKTTEQLVNRRLEPTDINIERSHQAAEVYATAKGIDTGKAYSQLLHSDGTLNLDAALKAGMDVSAFGKIAPELVEPWKQASEAWKAYANSSIDRVQLEKDLAAFRDKLPTKITVESYGALSDATAKLDATVAQARDSVDTSGSIGKAVVNAQDAVATARKLAADTRQFVTQGLPNATVNGLMNAAKGIDDATAAVRKAITDSKQFITQGLPDKAMNILMDAAKGLDDAIAQARAVIAAIKTFATDTIPDKTVNALMDAAKGLDDAVAKARELGTVTKAFVTQQVPNTAVDALMTAAKSVDDATAKMRLITQQAREYITQGLPDKAVNVLMDGAARLDDDIRKVTDLATKVRSYITTDLPDAVVNHLMDAAKGLDDSIATANRALSDAKVLLTQRIPDKAINVLMDAAQSVDDAAIKVRDSIQAARSYLTQTLPDATVNVLMDVAKRVDDATATTKEALTKMQRFVTAGLPDATVNALMDAAKGIDNAIARAEQIIKQANTMAHKLPDVAVNALMDAAKLVDDATTKANSALRQAREFITQGLPDKAMNVLMDAAKSVDDATARVKKFGVDIKAFVTEDLPDATVNALMDAAKALDDSIAAVKDAIPNAVKYIRDDIARARIERPVREALAKVGDDVERVNKAFKTGDSDALKSAVADARNDMASAEALVSSPDAVALLEQARQTLGDVVSLSVIPFEGVRPQLMARLAELQNKWASAVEAERGAEQKMVDTAGRYADQASTVAKLDPDTASRMKELPSWLKYATKDMVNRVMNPRTVDVITAERNQARLEVDKAVKEYSNNPEMWREPVQQLLDRERELMLSQSGKWETDLQTVVRTQQALKDLDALMTKAVSLEAKQAIQDLMTRIRERQAESAIIVNNMISDMENYWLDPNKSIIRKSTQELDVVLKQLAEAKDVLKPEGTLTIQELRDLQKLKMNQQNLETTIQTAKDLESQPLSDATKDIIKKERIDAENKQYGLNIMKDIEKSDAINEALKKLDTSKGISKSDWDNFASDAVWQGEKEAFRTMSEVDRLALEKAQERLQGLIDKGLQGFEDQNLLKRLEPEGRQANKAEEIAKQSEKTARDADDAYRAKEWGDSADDILKRAQMEQKVADLLERARIDRSNADFLTKDYKGGLETVYEKLADKFFDGDRNALEEYLRGEGSVGETLESGGLDQQQLKDKLDALMKDPEKLIDDMKTKARTELDDALDEIDKLLKRPDNAPSEGLADTLKDVDEFLKKGKESPGAPEQGIPTMITHQMEARLKALGYTDAEIASMTPQDEWERSTLAKRRLVKPANKSVHRSAVVATMVNVAHAPP